MQWMYSHVFGKKYHFTSNLNTNTIEHVSKKELYIILSTLEKEFKVKSDSFNQEISMAQPV